MVRSIAGFVSELDNELESIMDFWATKAIDNKNGGFAGSIDSLGRVNLNANKGAILNARILWSFSAAYNYTGKKQHLEMANRAYNYLSENFIDKINGGVLWELDSEGYPVNTRKQAYAQGFAIYGLSEYYRASGNKQSLEAAKVIYQLIEDKFIDPEYGGYIEALGEGWEQLIDMRLSPKDANEPKSMNTHLHILEPYTNLYRCWKNEKLANSIRKTIRVFLDHIIDSNTGHFNLFFDYNWEVKSNIISYGHDIEGSWLLYEAAEILEDKELIEEVKNTALKMVDITITEGFAPDGSVVYEKEGEHLDTDRHWWPQAEAMVGLVNAWQLNEDISYLSSCEKVWAYIHKYMIDKRNGEWYWKVDSNGEPDPDDEKAGFWKCPYHNSRALIEVATRLKNI
jgi:mannobiose 2-epimerase